MIKPSVGSNLVTLAEAGGNECREHLVLQSRRTANKCAIDIDAGLEAFTRLLSRPQGHGDHESGE